MHQVTSLLGCLAALLLAGQAGAFEFKSCDNGASELLTIVIGGCEGAKGAACQRKVGDTFSINATFITHNPFEEALIYLDSTVAGRPVHVVTGPACKLGIDCPSRANQEQSLALLTKVAANFAGKAPQFSFKLTSKAQDEFCVEFPLKIQA